LNTKNRIKIICGHYGCGKTNVCVNLALLYKNKFPSANVALADVDTVNPYFRAADAVQQLEREGIHTIIPEFANTNVDIPSLPAELYSLFSPASNTISFIDVGGDDGAAAIGMYSDLIRECGYEIGEVQPVDMFPRTGHVESVVCITRRLDNELRERMN
jgi:hypothetical protein